MTEQTRRYSVRLTDVESDRDLVFSVVELTDYEARVVAKQIIRLAGAPESVSKDFADIVATSPRKPP